MTSSSNISSYFNNTITFFGVCYVYSTANAFAASARAYLSNTADNDSDASRAAKKAEQISKNLFASGFMFAGSAGWLLDWTDKIGWIALGSATTLVRSVYLGGLGLGSAISSTLVFDEYQNLSENSSEETKQAAFLKLVAIVATTAWAVLGLGGLVFGSELQALAEICALIGFIINIHLWVNEKTPEPAGNPSQIAPT
jgi:hypothetical protein